METKGENALDHTVDERDFQQLAADRYTFSVLSRILRGPCDCIRTDHERLILCHSVKPYPVWIWTPDNISDDEKERAWRLASETLSPADGYRYNLKYDLAAYFMERARETGSRLHVSTNLFAYDCPEAIPPETPADGSLYVCTPEDTEEAADLIYQFHWEIAEDRISREDCARKAEQHISHSAFFLWKNSAGNTVACCSYARADENLGSVGSVYTKPAYRRRHYAQHMVYQVTRLIAGYGLTPMLYTDADYAASNACYEKIGYVIRGKLCTIAAQ